MNVCINLNNIPHKILFPKSEENNKKKWSYSFVYSLLDLKNIFLVLNQKFEFSSFKDIANFCNNQSILSEKNQKWNVRRIEEIVNALRNFKIIEHNGFTPLISDPFNTKLGEDLSYKDIDFFKKIFMSYFRFKEFHQLFLYGKGNINIDVLQENSNMIYSYISEGRFVNNFILNNNDIILEIESKNSDLMRFWDVYIKWGTTLGLIEKYPMKPFGVTTLPNVKSFSLVYFVKEMPPDFSIFTYIEKEIKTSFIYIPDLIFSIIKHKRFSLKSIIDELIIECKTDGRFRAQNASTIFINEKEKFLIPKINNIYVSHLLKL